VAIANEGVRMPSPGYPITNGRDNSWTYQSDNTRVLSSRFGPVVGCFHRRLRASFDTATDTITVGCKDCLLDGPPCGSQALAERMFHYFCDVRYWPARNVR
jgi:hypothetical protein